MKKKTFTAIVCILMTLAVVAAIPLRAMLMNEDDSQTAIVNCEVADKYWSVASVSNGKKAYHITLRFADGQNEFEKDATVSKKYFYNKIKTGDVIPCIVTYDEMGIIKIEVAKNE